MDLWMLTEETLESDTQMMKTVWPDLSRCTSWSNGSDKIFQSRERYTQPEDGECQSCEQLVDVDEPHAE
jgi:hypothetical protein